MSLGFAIMVTDMEQKRGIYSLPGRPLPSSGQIERPRIDALMNFIEADMARAAASRAEARESDRKAEIAVLEARLAELKAEDAEMAPRPAARMEVIHPTGLLGSSFRTDGQPLPVIHDFGDGRVIATQDGVPLFFRLDASLGWLNSYVVTDEERDAFTAVPEKAP